MFLQGIKGYDFGSTGRYACFSPIYCATCHDFLTGLIIADTDKRARRILIVLAVGAGLISLFGLGQFLLFPKMLLTESKRYYLDSLTRRFSSTAIRRQPSWGSAFSWRRHSRRKMAAPTSVFHPRHLAISMKGLGFWVFAGLGLSCLTALMLTQSRAGLVVTGLGSVLYLPYLASQWKSARSRLFPQAGGSASR